MEATVFKVIYSELYDGELDRLIEFIESVLYVLCAI